MQWEWLVSQQELSSCLAQRLSWWFLIQSVFFWKRIIADSLIAHSKQINCKVIDRIRFLADRSSWNSYRNSYRNQWFQPSWATSKYWQKPFLRIWRYMYKLTASHMLSPRYFKMMNADLLENFLTMVWAASYMHDYAKQPVGLIGIWTTVCSISQL